MKTLKKKILSFPVVARYIRDRAYRNELRLIKNKRLKVSSKPSCLHFSLNKSATQYVKGILIRVAKENDLLPVHIHEYAFNSNLPYLDHLTSDEMRKYSHIFRERGLLYTVFGGYIQGIPNLDAYKIVFNIRDPRDILVSSYFSKAYSHALPAEHSNKRASFQKQRSDVLNQTIDEFALSEAKRLEKSYSRYWNHLVKSNADINVLKYEDMISDFEGWLDQLLMACGCQISSALRQTIITEFKETQGRKENKHSHLRKGVVNDFREKLKPETIARLNEVFKDVLTNFEYKI